ncbi:hypothetical protein RO3G_00799 [Rhizopus delemar RA 99-880]|uniref:C3H1-type domain-containing protein n=1 Tax=Rhizopus delemar (strain RA 99-880 / ATCC MYA-4621 / FGSC 9543 / NRRL 43880) TaxID=246409 RepID=I1BIR5_RHIO9|nr:hypothetical protein RO3G_00799 [Rhizopus delemar RA 99-880]|eukprot:EIE76095.1 hypothetical protein RO3G_00799 [Rhizopus delemar RA 99-880]
MSSDLHYKEIALYKTESCRNWDETGSCRYGKRCRYAHGPEELRAVPRSSQYKTKACRSYHEKGACPYGVRCTFKHLNDEPTIVLKQNSKQIWNSMLGLSIAHYRVKANNDASQSSKDEIFFV